MEPDIPNFDSLAHVYRWMEYCSFGRMLERCRFHFLARCSQASRALVLGDGDGRFTARLMTVNSTIHVDAVDASAAMLHVLRERAHQGSPDADSRLCTIRADLRRFTPPQQHYDLVASHFFLDCLADGEVAALIERISPHMTQDAIWLVSEFAVPGHGWRRFGARVVIRSLYFAFFLLTRLQIRHLPDYSRAFQANGFFRREKTDYLGGMLFAEVWERRADS